MAGSFFLVFGSIAAMALAGCASPPTRMPVADPAPVDDQLAPALVFGPLAHRATAFNEPITPPIDNAILDEVFAGLVEFVHDRGTPERDPRLDAACAALAELAQTPSSDLVQFALHEFGVVEPAVVTLVEHGASASQLLAELRGDLGTSLDYANVRIGLGGVEPTVAIVTYRSPIEPIATPRAIAAGADLVLRAKLDPAFGNVRVTHAREDGSIVRPPVTIERDQLAAPIACAGHRGTQWITIEADGDKTTARSVVPIACGDPPPESYRFEPAANLTTTDLARRVVALIDRDRRAHGVELLAIDARATSVARAYATTMAAAGSITHTLGGTTFVQRLAAASLVPTLALETTLHADSFAIVAERLQNQAAYRADLLDPRVNRAGVGIASDGHGGIYVAIEYLRVVPAIDIARISTQLRGALHVHAPLATITPNLSSAARWYADRLALGWSRETITTSFGHEYTLNDLGVTSVGAITLPFDHVPPGDAASTTQRSRTHLDLGVALAQSAREGPYCGRIWLVILFGPPRHRAPH